MCGDDSVLSFPRRRESKVLSSPFRQLTKKSIHIYNPLHLSPILLYKEQQLNHNYYKGGYTVENERLTEITKGVIQKRINLLAGIIANGNHVESAKLAALQLGFIGTKESSNALLYLITQTEDPGMQGVMIASLIFNTPLRDEYREKLAKACINADMIDEIYAMVTECNQGLFGPPLWQEIANALAGELIHALYTIDDPAVGD